MNLANSNSCEQILSNADLTRLITNDETLGSYAISLDYRTLRGDELSVAKKTQVVHFINKHYKCKKETLSLHYTFELFDYFINSESVIIEFTPKDSDRQIGLIIGKPTHVVIDGKIDTYIEVNFLCLNERLRNLHASSFMINILTRVCIEKLNIGVAHYTVGKEIASPSFCRANLYHRPLDVARLLDCGFFSDTMSKRELELEFCDFSDDCEIHVEHVNGYVPEYTDYIFEKLVAYRREIYRIYEMITIEDLRESLLNAAFHHFVFRKDGGISAYYCLFEQKVVNNNTGRMYSNGIIYRSFSEDLDKVSMLETLAKKCSDLGIFECITKLGDVSEVDRWILGSGVQNYYIFNKHVPEINQSENALVTI